MRPGRTWEGEKKWRWDGTDAPEGELGEGRDSHTWSGPLMAWGLVGMERDFWRVGGSEGNMASVSPTPSDPRKPAGVLGLSPPPPGPPAADWDPGLSPALPSQGLSWLCGYWA